MTTITLEVPDELAMRISNLGPTLPGLLARAVQSETAIASAGQTAATHPVYQEMMDFLAMRPAPQRMIEFRISAGAQERLSELLEKNQEEGLSLNEAAELDVYELVHHSIIRLKAQARLQQS